MGKKKLRTLFAVLLLGMVILLPQGVLAGSGKETVTDSKVKAVADGQYINWDGTSNVCQFVDGDGNLCFAYDGKKKVTVVRTEEGHPVEGKISLKKMNPLFGGVICDSDGNYYVVTGEINSGDNTDMNTIFISKYNSEGQHIQTVGDNGSSSLASYYDSDFYTRIPFDGGNCDIAINGDILAVNYAREMYSGHQSNSIFAINMTTMTKVNIGIDYNSHSFAQRAVKFQDGFIFASEGDCYDRAFTVSRANINTGSMTASNIFHFWVEKGTLSNWDMFTLNDNFAHMGGVADVNGRLAALVGTSAKSLDENVLNETEQLFIQIFDPLKKLDEAESYITTGKRSGLSGGDGDESVTDYGVKWLTGYNNNTSIKNPQVASDGNGNIAVFYEKYVNNRYKGVYYKLISETGKTIKKATRFSKKAYLNPCRMPVYSNGSFYWVANRSGSDYLYIYRLEL